MTFDKKLIWTITDGSQGMRNQVNGLAQQFSKNISEIKTALFFPWSILQPGFLPFNQFIFKNKFRLNDLPFMVISCGRKSVYASLYLKSVFKKKITTIHIQNPKINPNKFDFVIAPNHDRFVGKNVINSTGALHHLTKEKILNNKDNFYLDSKKNIISIIIGGPNNHYHFSNYETDKIISFLKDIIFKNKNFSYFIVPSRRTTDNIINKIKNSLGDKAFIWEKKGINPYLYCLKNSKFFIVTSDSTSMISECAFTGKPVYIYDLPFKRKSVRFENFHNEFEKLGITRKISYNLSTWNYKSLNEAKRIASILRIRILNKENI